MAILSVGSEIYGFRPRWDGFGMVYYTIDIMAALLLEHQKVVSIGWLI